MTSQTNTVMTSQTNTLWLWKVRPTPIFVILWLCQARPTLFRGYDKPDQHFVVMPSQTNMLMPSQTNILWLWQVRPTPYFDLFFAPCGYAKPDQHFLWLCQARPTFCGYEKPDQHIICGYDKPDQRFVVMPCQTNVVMPSKTNILWSWQVRPTDTFSNFLLFYGYVKPDQHILWLCQARPTHLVVMPSQTNTFSGYAK